MRLEGAIVGYQPAEPKLKNGRIYNGNDVKVEKTTTKLPIRVANLISQKQLPDTLHSKANVILFFMPPI